MWGPPTHAEIDETAGSWRCSCGWINRASHLKCGGESGGAEVGIGCGLPRVAPNFPGATPLVAPVQTTPGPGSASPWGPDVPTPANSAPSGLPSTAGTQTWTCSCGWSNRPQNVVCGGGRAGYGCGEPRLPSPAADLALALSKVQLSQQSMAPPTPAQPTGAPVQQWPSGLGGLPTAQQQLTGPSTQPPMHHAGNQMQPMGQPPQPSPWLCSCGWSNRAQNAFCGNGKPGYGCGAPRVRVPGQPGYIGASIGEATAHRIQRNSSDPRPPWTCTVCGWQNRARNSTCGGGSPAYGCGAPQNSESPQVRLLLQQVQSALAQQADPAAIAALAQAAAAQAAMDANMNARTKAAFDARRRPAEYPPNYMQGQQPGPGLQPGGQPGPDGVGPGMVWGQAP